MEEATQAKKASRSSEHSKPCNTVNYKKRQESSEIILIFAPKKVQHHLLSLLRQSQYHVHLKAYPCPQWCCT